MRVSKAQIMGMKCLRNKLIKKTKDSLKKRFLSDEIEVLTAISKILSPSTNQHLPLDKEIEFLCTKYPISLDKAILHTELKVLRGLKKSLPHVETKIIFRNLGWELFVINSKLWCFGPTIPVGSNTKCSGGEDLQFSKFNIIGTKKQVAPRNCVKKNIIEILQINFKQGRD